MLLLILLTHLIVCHFIKVHMNPQSCSAEVTDINSSVKKEIAGGGHERTDNPTAKGVGREIVECSNYQC